VRFAPVLLAILIALLNGCYRGSRPPHIGTAAPEFTVQDADRKVALSDLRGQVVVLNFWATWCAPCVEEMPSLVQLQQRFKDKGITVVGISIDVDGDAYHKFL
jgi:cytochrome c biogenesis protein CcmG/thiol:disulfide interchange protein DsbE